MSQSVLRDLFRFLRRANAAAADEDPSDGALLARFLLQRDEAAFERLVERHGPMVLGVCQRVAGERHAAEDAFQATFLVLARRAGSIRNQASVGSWLYGIAQRIARRARVQAALRRERERRAAAMRTDEALDEPTWQELRRVLDEEMGRLSETYRAAVVLCYLEGKSHARAAQELGWPRRTLTNRLARALELLRGRLVRRGITLSAGALLAALTEKAAAATVPALLVLPLVRAAAEVAAGQAPEAGSLSTQVITLAEEAMKTTIWIKGKLVLLLLALGLAVGAGVAGYDAWVGQAPPEQPAPVLQGDSAKKAAPGPAKDLHGDPLPAGAVARLGQDRWLHQNAEFAAFLPDGKTVVTVSDDMTVRFWEFPAGKEIVHRRITLTEPGQSLVPFAVAALSRDGKTLATSFPTFGAEREIQFHDVPTGKRLPDLKIPFPAGSFRIGDLAIAFSPNGDHLAVRTRDGTVRVWDWAKSKEVCKLPPYEGSDGYAVKLEPVYAPDGKVMATTPNVREGNDLKRVVKLWNAVTGAEIRTIRPGGENSPLLFVAFSPDGKALAVATVADVKLVDASSGKEIRPLGGPPIAGPGGLKNPVFSNDGKKLYALSGGARLREWDVATGKVLRECPSTLRAFAQSGFLSLSPDGNALVLTGPGPQFYDLSGKGITAVNRPAAPLQGLHFTSDGKTLLTHRRETPLYGAEWVVGKWEVATGKDLGILKIRVPPVPILRTALSPDGRVGVSFGRFAKPPKTTPAILFDTATGKVLVGIANSTLGLCVFSADGKMVAVGSVTDRKQIHLYEAPTGTLLHTLDAGPGFPAGKGGGGGPASSLNLIFSPDGKLLASFAEPQTVTVWDTPTGRRLGSVTTPQDNSSSHAAFSPDGRCLAVDGNDGTAVVYELATARPRRRFGKKQAPPTKLGPFGPATEQQPGSRVAFSPGGKWFAQGNPDGTVHVYDILTGQELAAFKGHTAAVNAVAFALDGKRMASASDDSTALIWDLTKMVRPAVPAKTLRAGDFANRWEALAESDAAQAFAAMGDLIAVPEDAVAWIKERVKPATPVEAKRIEELLRQLGDAQFKVRDQAAKELIQIGEQTLPLLDRALAANPPLETKRRLEALRGKLTGMILQGERLRAHRAVEVLERIGTPQARQVLQALADGAPGALVTTSAQAALKR
jgi:RNA polymerase sigma factor (sigma-70 family)